jgi:hypothetical protein
MSLREEYELELGRKDGDHARSPEELHAFLQILADSLLAGFGRETRAIEPALEESWLKRCSRWTSGVADTLKRGVSGEPGIRERLLNGLHLRAPARRRFIRTHSQLDQREIRLPRDGQGDESGSDKPAAAVFRDEPPHHQPATGERGPRLPPTRADDQWSVGYSWAGGCPFSSTREGPGAGDADGFQGSLVRQRRRLE